MSNLINLPTKFNYKDVEYSLIFNNYSMILLEELTNQSFDDFTKTLASGHAKIKDLYILITVGLHENHKLSFEEVVKIFDLFDMEKIQDPLIKAFENYFPKKK